MIDEPTLNQLAHYFLNINKVSTYYVPFLSGFLSIYIVYVHIATDQGEKWWKALIVPLFAIYFGMMVGSLFGVFLNGKADPWAYWTSRSLSKQFQIIFSPFAGGKVLYGGFLGMILGIFLSSLTLYQKRWKKAFARSLDAFSIATPLLFMFNRVGCIFYGCCYGKISSWGINIPPAHQSYEEYVDKGLIIQGDVLHLIPTQMISLWANFVIFLFLFLLYRQRRETLPRFFYFWTYTVSYGLFRFIIEFLRADRRDFFLGLSTSQWIPLILFIPATLFFVRIAKGK
ncbi:prolipoprotein diacylglyceryl transferase [bacterium]|nr:prolipoprotein diacylglyceryl transferase [bacterium]